MATLFTNRAIQVANAANLSYTRSSSANALVFGPVLDDIPAGGVSL